MTGLALCGKVPSASQREGTLRHQAVPTPTTPPTVGSLPFPESGGRARCLPPPAGKSRRRATSHAPGGVRDDRRSPAVGGAGVSQQLPPPGCLIIGMATAPLPRHLVVRWHPPTGPPLLCAGPPPPAPRERSAVDPISSPPSHQWKKWKPLCTKTRRYAPFLAPGSCSMCSHRPPVNGLQSPRVAARRRRAPTQGEGDTPQRGGTGPPPTAPPLLRTRLSSRGGGCATTPIARGDGLRRKSPASAC